MTISEEQRARMSAAHKGHKHSLETRRRMSISGKGKKHKSPTKEQILRRIITRTGRKLSDEHKTRIGDSMRGKRHGPMSEEQKRLLSAVHKGQGKGIKKGPCSEEHKRKLSLARSKFIVPIKDTTIELAVKDRLKELQIPFKPHKSFTIRGFTHQVDVFIEPNICIECDGEYWHTLIINGLDTLRIKRDFIIDYELEKQGMIVIRLWGYDIKNHLDWCIRQITSRIQRDEVSDIDVYA